ncbi:hypothetical protein HPP92_024305 [Vanilla planifolia]|uniref:RNA exonuclease 4 n=1 Tax=Vanilla planifolia TaxID=51239 RepID=A0A835UCG6_VANPL|nr:hypothetical protein HPP92_024305 [Vanilla planifolia]
MEPRQGGMVGDGAEGAAAVLNPNWANLRQKLEARRHRKSTNPYRGGKGNPAVPALGKRKERPDPEPAATPSAPSVLEPTSEDFSLTEALAMDCEMVGVSTQGTKSALGRVTLVLLLSNPKKDIRDTAEYQPLLREGRRRSLKGLAFEILGVNIQQREHCPIEDARAAMLIYKRYKKEWESSIKKHAKFSKKLRNKHKNKSVYKQAAESNAPATS